MATDETLNQLIKNGGDNISVNGAVEIKEPLLCERNPTPNADSRRYYILRFMVLSLIILMAVFLLIYAGYLVAVQYLTAQADRFNVRLVTEDGTLYEVDPLSAQMLPGIQGNLSYNTTISAVIASLPYLKNIGVNSLVISNILNQDFSPKAVAGSMAEIRDLIYVAELEGMDLYLNLERKSARGGGSNRTTRGGGRTYSIDDAFSDLYSSDVQAENNSAITYQSNFSCIDGDLSALKEAIKLYASMGFDGFIVNDLPCCLVLGINSTTNGESDCHPGVYQDLRYAARKFGKPSALILRAPLHMYQAGYTWLSHYNGSVFDAVVITLGGSDTGALVIPSDIKENKDRKIHDIWHIDLSLFPSQYITPTKVRLLMSSVSFLPGSILITADDAKSIGMNESLGNLSQITGETLTTRQQELVAMVAQIRKVRNLSHCKTNSSPVIYNYANPDLFYVVMESADDDSTHCAMLVNFGDASTDVNMKAHLSQSEVHLVAAKVVLVISATGISLPNSSVTAQVFTLEPKSATVLQVEKKTN